MQARARIAALALAGALGPVPAPAQEAAEGALFVDRAAETGLDFVHFNGMSGERYFVENMGAGAALFDYDNDGDLDAYLVQGDMLGPDKTFADAIFAPRHPLPLTDRLYRNDLTILPSGERVLRFVDVTDRSGIEPGDYGMGIAAGDFDNDGWADLYVTAFGANRMLRNGGDGTFSDVTAETGTAELRWSVPASFVDIDRDGWLDLYVGNYVSFGFRDLPCTSATGTRDYCAPLSYRPESDRLFRNRGDGTFEDFTARGGVQGALGGALGVATADFDGDRRTDIYVANDMTPNLLWLARPDGTFSNEALFAGCAVNWEGKPEASMGVDAADIDGDGDEDLFMTHITGESNTLYLNDGRGSFEDATLPAGLAAPSSGNTAFGTAWLDYDNDGWLDLLVVNGAVKTLPALIQAGDPYPLHQPNQLFHNNGDGAFEEVSARAGASFELSEVSRGAAFGDVDNDGDVDVLVTNNAGPVRLLVNETGQASASIGLRLETPAASRPVVGARIVVETNEGELWRRPKADGSYASANDPRVLVGLGERSLSGVRVYWPAGGASHFPAWPPGALVTLHEPQMKATP
jgi:hypothetical protein